jgi:hypothetical protein
MVLDFTLILIKANTLSKPHKIKQATEVLTKSLLSQRASRINPPYQKKLNFLVTSPGPEKKRQ